MLPSAYSIQRLEHSLVVIVQRFPRSCYSFGRVSVLNDVADLVPLSELYLHMDLAGWVKCDW